MIQLYQITIIYPKSPGMENLARKLAADMKHYRIPSNVRKKTGMGGLGDMKQPWLIVLCDPATPSDEETCRLIRDFTDRGLYHHILTLLVEGTPETSFPDALLHEQLPDGTVVDHEPLAANVSAPSQRQRLRKLKVEKLRLLAPVLGVSFDELMNRRQRQRRRIVIAVGTVVLAGAAAFLSVIVQRIKTFQEQNEKLTAQYNRADAALQQTQERADEVSRSYAQAIGTGAGDAIETGDCEVAMLLCLELLPERSDVSELTDALAEALRLRGGKGYVPVTAVKDETDTGAENEADTGAEDEIFELPADLPSDYGMEWHRAYSSEGYLLYIYGEEELHVYDPAGGKEIGTVPSYQYPLHEQDTGFAGPVDKESGLPDSSRVRCGDLLFEYREEETPVPDDLAGQIELAETYLNGRTLTPEERSYFGMDRGDIQYDLFED